MGVDIYTMRKLKNDNRVAARMLTQMLAGKSHVFICFASCCHLEGILPNQYTRKFAVRANFSVFCFLNWYCPSPTGRTRFRMLQSELDLERKGEPHKTITYVIIYVFLVSGFSRVIKSIPLVAFQVSVCQQLRKC